MSFINELPSHIHDRFDIVPWMKDSLGLGVSMGATAEAAIMGNEEGFMQHGWNVLKNGYRFGKDIVNSAKKISQFFGGSTDGSNVEGEGWVGRPSKKRKTEINLTNQKKFADIYLNSIVGTKEHDRIQQVVYDTAMMNREATSDAPQSGTMSASPGIVNSASGTNMFNPTPANAGTVMNQTNGYNEEQSAYAPSDVAANDASAEDSANMDRRNFGLNYATK